MSAQLQFGFFDEEETGFEPALTAVKEPAPAPSVLPKRDTAGWFPLKPTPKIIEPVSLETQLDEATVWNDSEIIMLMERLITKSIEQVADEHFSLKFREEVLEWFMEEGANAPLSFEACCKVCGYDPEMLRLKIRQRWDNKDFYLSNQQLREWNARHSDFM